MRELEMEISSKAVQIILQLDIIMIDIFLLMTILISFPESVSSMDHFAHSKHTLRYLILSNIQVILLFLFLVSDI